MTELLPTVFLDRDGVINVPTGIPHTYVLTWEEFIFLPDVAKSIRRLNDAGFRVVVVTNQRAVARGLITSASLAAIHERMLEELALEGAIIDKVYVCEHEGGCSCRKPLPGLLMQADVDHPVDKRRSVMVGDSETDVEAAHAFGVEAILLGPCGIESRADRVCGSLSEATDLIIGDDGK